MDGIKTTKEYLETFYDELECMENHGNVYIQILFCITDHVKCGNANKNCYNLSKGI